MRSGRADTPGGRLITRWWHGRVAAMGDCRAEDRRLFAPDTDLYVMFPVLCNSITGLSCGAVAALAMLQWATGCSFQPKVGGLDGPVVPSLMLMAQAASPIQR